MVTVRTGHESGKTKEASVLIFRISEQPRLSLTKS